MITMTGAIHAVIQARSMLVVSMAQLKKPALLLAEFAREKRKQQLDWLATNADVITMQTCYDAILASFNAILLLRDVNTSFLESICQ
jgi:hypothetical protein